MGSIIKVNEYKDFGNNAIMTSDGSGNLTTQEINFPAFHAYSTAAQSIANTTWTTITFTTEDFDTANAFDTSTGVFTVPSGRGGKYVFYCGAALDNVTPSRFLLTGYQNDSTERLSTETGSASSYSAINVCGQINLSAADNFRFKIYQNNGGSVNTFAYRHLVFFGGYRIGS